MKKKVMIFPSGSEIGLEINNALKYSTHFEVYGLTSVPNHSEFVYTNCITGIPYYNAPDFIEKLNKIIDEYGIDYIYPAYDDVQLYLVENSSLIHAVIVSADLFTTDICRSKTKTYDYFSSEDFIPSVYSSPEEIKIFPVFLKPDIGQGSQGAVAVNNPEELSFALSEDPCRIICEYLSGEEYTIDCFTGLGGNISCMKIRNRKRIRTGISVSSEILPLDDDVIRIGNIINSKLKFKGAWFFQLKKNSEGKYKLLEAAARIAGTMGITRNSGTNYPLMTLFNFEGIDVKAIENNFNIVVDRAFISRYKTDIQYDIIYLDFDDTLCLKGKVNTFLIMFLYQAKNKGKSIILLSRHSKDIYNSLKECRISEALFDDIIIIKDDRKKSSYIKEEKAIFIDDSFAERRDVNAVCRIPVFDCSEVECLTDWRIYK